MSEKRRNKGGRNPKLDPAVFRYTVRFSEEEHNRFLSMFEKSGVNARLLEHGEETVVFLLVETDGVAEHRRIEFGISPAFVSSFFTHIALDLAV